MLKEIYQNALKGPWQTVGLDLQYRIEGHTIYFLCSSSKQDWENNFKFSPILANRKAVIPYKDQPIKWRAHKGFVSIWKSGRDIIIPQMMSANIDTIAGVSLGGALSILAHEDYYFHTGIHANTYCFGVPRVIWFSSKVSDRWENVLLVENKGDIVTNVPPWWMGYRKVGDRFKIGKWFGRSRTEMYWYTHHTIEQYLEALKDL
jgi:hypothetical protein